MKRNDAGRPDMFLKNHVQELDKLTRMFAPTYTQQNDKKAK